METTRKLFHFYADLLNMNSEMSTSTSEEFEVGKRRDRVQGYEQ